MELKKAHAELAIEAVLDDLEHLKFNESDDQVEVSLIDLSGHEIVRGYGTNFIDAINDLHGNLL